MKTKTKPEAPAIATVSTAAPVENNPRPDLAALETAFETLYKSMFGVLIEIRDRELYKEMGFASFSEYGASRWRERVRSMAAGDLAPFRPMIGPDRNAPKAPKVKAPKAAAPAPVEAPAPVQSEPDPNHLPKGKTLMEVFAAEIKETPAPVEGNFTMTPVPAAKPAKKSAKAKPVRADKQVKAKAESLGQLKNRARMAKGETKLALVAQIRREHGPAAAAGLMNGEATEVPGVNNLPAVGVIG